MGVAFMKVRPGLLLPAFAWILVSGCFSSAVGAPAPQSGAATARTFLDQYCTGCHNDKAKVGGLSLQSLDVSLVSHNAQSWEKVVKKLRAGLMPPSGAHRPELSSINAFSGWLEGELDRGSAKLVAAAPTMHRLNRAEYANAVRDLLGLEVDTTTLLPADDSSYGFDNMAGTLGVSAALMERYLAAGAKLSRLAIGNANAVPSQKTYSAPADMTQNYHVEGLPFGTRGGLLIRHQFPADGEYAIRVDFLRDYNGSMFGANAKGERLEVSVNGERIRLFDIDTEVIKAGFVETKPLEVRVPLKAGLQSIGVTFPARNYGPVEDSFQPFERSVITLTLGKDWTVLPHVGSVTVTGPFQASGIADTPSRQRIFSCRPASAQQEPACARTIVSTLARRAFRRPVTDEDLESVMSFYEFGRAGKSFESGIELALRRILASPDFVFRLQSEPSSIKAGATYRISDIQLASRLSFFLWSSIPDDELLRVAERGRLRQPTVLEQQVRRMLADPRAEALVSNFGGQWLYLRNLPSIVPALNEFPDFDDNLRQSFRRETEMFLGSIIREDRSIHELLNGNYTFVNERLARHYGIPNVYGSQFRRVTLTDESRRGLLGQGSVLLATSYATRTSPVLRGKWILENILGTPPPEPPPNVPALKESTAAGSAAADSPSVRQRLEEHRANPSCSSCHRMMDPIGFALENFDAVGKWRSKDGRTAVDASGVLVDGTKVTGPASLRQGLMRYSEQFSRTVAEKLLTYGLGRGVEYYDMPVVRSIVRDAARNDYRFSSFILGIVQSQPFQMAVKQQQ